MSTPFFALATEFWILGRARIISALIGISCVNALYYHLATSISDSLPPEVQHNLFFATFFTDITLIVLNLLLLSRDTGSSEGVELEPRAFLLPIPTHQLVFLRMLFPAITAGVLWILISAFTLAVTSEGATGEHWPMLGPALVAATLTVWGLALFWFPLRPLGLKTLTFISVPFALLIGIVMHLDSLGDSAGTTGSGSLSLLTAGDLLVLLGLMAAAYAVGVFGVSRARCGLTLGFPSFAELVDRLGSRRQVAGGSFRSPQAAQIWFEWRQKGWIIPTHVGFGLLFTAVLIARKGDTEAVLPALLKLLVFCFFLVPPMMGCLIGRFHQSSANAEMDLFRASRPLSDTTFAGILLRVGALSLLATWVTSIVTTLGVVVVLDAMGSGGQLDRAWLMVQAVTQDLGWSSIVLRLVGLVAVSWMNMALVASIFLTGRNKMVTALVFVPYGFGLTAFLVFKTMGAEAIGGLVVAGAWLFSATALVVTVLAFTAARRRHLLARWLPATALGIAILVGSGVAWHQADRVNALLASSFALERSILVVGPGLLALALAPLALAPLALSWNRHR